jgi:hypothetical protein
MSDEALLVWLEERAAAGRLDYADTLRALVIDADPALAAGLPFEKDSVFLEPSLFAVFASPGEGGATLPQRLAAAFAGRAGRTLPVRSDGAGTIHLPRLGQLSTALGDAEFKLVRRGGEWHLSYAGKPVPFTPAPVHIVRGIELLTAIPPYFRPLLPAADRDGAAIDEAAFARAAAAALDAVAAAWPAMSRCLRAHLRTIVALPADGVNSFAAPAAHGAIFVSVADTLTVPQLIEELAHQGGHVIFGAATVDPGPLLEVAPDTPMRAYSDAAEDRRSVYEALHGLLTEALMVVVLDRCLSLRRWSARERLELRGRLAYIGVRAHGELASFAAAGLLSPEGRGLRDLVAACLYPSLQRRRRELEPLDLSQQPYAFDEAVFRRVNRADPGFPAPA